MLKKWFPLLADPNTHIYLVRGKMDSSGSDMVRDSNSDSGKSRRRWAKVGGVTLIAPNDDVYFAHQQNLAVAYSKTDMSVLAYWNYDTKTGSNSTLLGLIFHPFILMHGLFIGIILLGMGKSFLNIQYAKPAILGFTLLVAIYAYFDWRATRLAHQKLKEYLDKA